MAESSKSDTSAETELTMCDVLQEEQELEEDANAVLGGSDDTNCSYDEGYVPRQALYACTSCSTTDEPAGICLACCYACHDGHEVVELYTKRNFRCDCGNSKFDKRCNLRPEKELRNVNNKYNQNFKGLYCSCSRPYPDFDDNTSDEMIQCVICEDWYHGRHLGDVAGSEDYSEMICDKCMGCHKFLYLYLNKLRNNKACTLDNDDQGVDVKVKAESAVGNDCNNSSVETCGQLVKEEVDVEKVDAELNGVENSSNGIDEGIDTVKKEDGIIKEEKSQNSGDEKCIMTELEAKNNITNGPAFFPDNWRSELCHCSKCMEMYQKFECLFLLDPEDTIHAYEERGKCRSNVSQYDRGLSALSKLDRVKGMEAIQAFSSMKSKLKEYLKEFADNKRTVCESDIKEFFERMSKRQRLDNGVPHFCR